MINKVFIALLILICLVFVSCSLINADMYEKTVPFGNGEIDIWYHPFYFTGVHSYFARLKEPITITLNSNTYTFITQFTINSLVYQEHGKIFIEEANIGLMDSITMGPYSVQPKEQLHIGFELFVPGENVNDFKHIPSRVPIKGGQSITIGTLNFNLTGEAGRLMYNSREELTSLSSTVYADTNWFFFDIPSETAGTEYYEVTISTSSDPDIQFSSISELTYSPIDGYYFYLNQGNNSVDLYGQTLSFSLDASLSLYPDGDVKSLYLPIAYNTSIGINSVTLPVGTQVEFYESDEILSLYLNEPWTYLGIEYPTGTLIQFLAEGEIEMVIPPDVYDIPFGF